MTTTPKLALPYPGLTNAPNVPADIQALAMAVDANVPQVSWSPNPTDVKVGTGVIVIPSTVFPATNHPTRVYYTVEGQAGFDTGAVTVGVHAGGSHTITTRTLSTVNCPASEWRTVSASGRMDIPSGVGGAINIASDVAGGVAYFRVAATFIRVAN